MEQKLKNRVQEYITAYKCDIKKWIETNNISIKNLAKLISKITKTPYSINKNSQPDKRTYRVNFDKFKKRTGTLTKNFNDLKKIIESLAKYFKSSKFKEQSRNYRLNHLKKK